MFPISNSASCCVFEKNHLPPVAPTVEITLPDTGDPPPLTPPPAPIIFLAL